MNKIILIILTIASVSVYAQTYTPSISGNTNPVVEEAEYYTVDWDPYSPGSGGNYNWGADIGQVMTSDETSCYVIWTSTGSGTLYFDYETWSNYYSTYFYVTVEDVPPSPPPTGSASNIAVTSFRAGWGTASGAVSYRLDVSSSSSFSSFVSGYNNLTVGTNYADVTGLNPGTTYYYRVRAVNSSDAVSGNSSIMSTLTLPVAPTSNAAVNTATTSFTASWQNVGSATGYHLDVSTSSSFSNFVTGYNSLSVGSTTQSVTGLSAGATYYYRVRAVNASGSSVNSNTITILTLPAAPVANSGSTITSSSFTASWNSVSSATGYRIDVSSNSSFSSLVSGYGDLPVGATNKSITGLSPGTTYYYRVRAINGSGTSANSGSATVLTLAEAPQANTGGNMTASSFTASWNAVFGATAYRLDVSESETFSAFVSGYNDLLVGTTSENVSGLDPGKTYYYRVRAVNESGASSNSNVVPVLTIPPNAVATAATNYTSTSFHANWNGVTSATSYRLDVSTSSSFASFVMGYENLLVTGIYKHVTGLTAGTVYYYRVRSTNATGTSDHSNAISSLTRPASPVANNASSIATSSFYASWSTVPTATRYRLDVSTSSAFSTTVSGYDNLAIGGISKLVTGLAAGTNYYYRVRAANGSGPSGNSNSINVLTICDAPIFDGEYASTLATNSFTISWQTVTGAASYHLDVSPNSSFSTFVPGYEDISVSTTSQSITGLSAGTEYYCRVRAVNASGTSGNSATVSVLTITDPPLAAAASNITSGSFTANWTTVAGASGYLLDVSKSEQFTSFVSGYEALSLSALSAAVSGLDPETTYYYRARAVNQSGASDYSQSITVITDDFIPLYNGIITSVRWRTDKAYNSTESDYSGMYLFSYDDKYQIRKASWAEPNHSLSTFTKAGDKFRVLNPAYDPNGNIQQLKRYDADGLIQHDFTYAYNQNPSESKNNQLEGISGYTAYHYNEIGQLTEELKDNGPDQYIEYDVTGKVRKIYSEKDPLTGEFVENSLKVQFIYDDRGFRLAKINHQDTVTTWYIRDASGNVISIYEQEDIIGYDGNGSPVESAAPLVQTEIPIYGLGKLGTYYPQQAGSTAYEITDHLGNVRALVREDPDTYTSYTATMEDNGQAEYANPRVQEMNFFQNLFETEVSDANMNHTSATETIVSNPSRSAYLFWQSGVSGMEASDKSIGPAAVLRVIEGDKLKLETWVRYKKKVDYTNDIALLALSQLLGSTFAGQGAFEGYTSTQTASTFGSVLGAGGFDSDGSDETRPFAYLNYILFDDNMVMVDAGWERVPEEAGFDPGEEGLPDMHAKVEFVDPIEISATGYVYIWVSNESENTQVWFDDLKVSHREGVVMQTTDYGVWGDVIREQKAEESFYRYGYQGQFAEKDEETGWNHFELREYDPVVGRWTSKDPAGQYYSPYVGMGNNPVSGVDPDGAWLFGLFGSTSAQRQAARADATAFEGARINNFFSKDINVTWSGALRESPSPHLYAEQNHYTFSYNKDGSSAGLEVGQVWSSFSGIAEFDPLGQLTFAPGFGAAVGIPARGALIFAGRMTVTAAGRYALNQSVRNFTSFMTAGELNAFRFSAYAGVRAMMRGKGIDAAFRFYAGKNWILQGASNFGFIRMGARNFGADMIGGRGLSGYWWDVTTNGAWNSHVLKYGSGGTGLIYR